MAQRAPDLSARNLGRGELAGRAQEDEIVKAEAQLAAITALRLEKPFVGE
jgi:hypothetical protein